MKSIPSPTPTRTGNRPRIQRGAATRIFLGLALLVSLAASPAHAKYGYSSYGRPSIVDLAQGAPQLSILVDAVVRAGLVETLSGRDRLTVFAPTNDAFIALLGELGLSSLEDVPVDTLRAILLDHVVPGTNSSRRLAYFDLSDRNLSSIGGLELDFDRHPLEVNDIRLVAKDLRARNGVVHVIEAVLQNPDPRPSIVDLAVGSEDPSILVEAATRTGLASILANGSPFTVFAPTNAAFLRLLDELGVDSLDDIDDRTLTNVLLDHVVARELDPAELGARRYVRAIGRLGLRVDRRVTKVNGIPIVASGLEAENGTVYVIDGVLLSH